MIKSESRAHKFDQMSEGEYKARTVIFWQKIGEFLSQVWQPNQEIKKERQKPYIIESLNTAAKLDWSSNLSDLAADTLPSKDFEDLWEKFKNFLEQASAAGWPEDKIIQQIELMAKEARTGEQQRGFDALALNSLPLIPE